MTRIVLIALLLGCAIAQGAIAFTTHGVGAFWSFGWCCGLLFCCMLDTLRG